MGIFSSPVRRTLVLTVLGVTAMAAPACSSGGTSSAPTATVTVSQSPAASSTQAGVAPSSPPTTSAAPAAGPAKCATSALRVRAGTSQGTAGTIYTNIDFTNSSGAACVLQGYPGVSLVSAGTNAGSQIGADAKRLKGTAVHPITLAPGQTAHAVLGVAEAGNFAASSCHPVTAHWLKVFPPDQFSAAYAPFTTQTCASTSQPTMTITPITAGA